MNQQRVLEDLYDATEEELLYGVGLLALPEQEPTPFVLLHYRGWSREKLEIVRESLQGGLVLTLSCRAEGTRDLHVSTRECVTVQATEGDHTSVLRAPAWDAHLEGIDDQVARRFEAERQRYGGFLLLMKAFECEFLVAVNDAGKSAQIGPIVSRSFPIPTG